MIRSLYRTHDGRIRTDLTPEKFTAALRDAKGLLWVDFSGTPPEEDAPILLNTFGFHPLAVDDALQESHVPKIDDWEQYLYIALHAIIFDQAAQDGEHLDLLELDVFLGKHYLVTHHDKPIVAVDRVWANCQRDERHLKAGADHLLYELADGVVADYMIVVDEIDEAIDRLEDEVFDKPTPDTLEQIFKIKRAVLNLRRILSPQREVLNRLARDDYPVVDAKDRIYFRDVYDHLVRLYDINESLRDLVSGALDTYLSVINNRMNEIMKTLTVVTTLFMPISFAAGFFGMNFFQPIEDPLKAWTTSPAFILAVAVMLLTPMGMYLWIRRRGWM
jgi:magnesium transporter